MKPSFTILELVIVIILIAILIFSINISIPNDKLQLAVDSLKRYLNYTHSLALKDDKFIPIPDNSSENNESKYWFRRFWQLKIGKTQKNTFFIQVYTDSNLSGSISVNDYAKDPLTDKYINGNYNSLTADPDANLSHFNITNVVYVYKNQSYNLTTRGLHIYFDNFGNVYISKNNNNDVNIFKNMKLLTSNLKIYLFQNNKSKKIIITPTGYVY